MLNQSLKKLGLLAVGAVREWIPFIPPEIGLVGMVVTPVLIGALGRDGLKSRRVSPP